MLPRKKFINLSGPVIMGILNVTPDSFSDGNKSYLDIEKNIKRVKKMEKEGASIIDIGPESTKPGSTPVSKKEQLKRCIPLIKKIKETMSIPISIDTSDPDVMEESIKNGVELVNDIRGLSENGSLEVIKKYDVHVCISHIKGNPKNMQKNPFYEDVVSEIYNFFSNKIKQMELFGIDRKKIIIDPGFGFGKTLEDNIKILNALHILKKINSPVLVGISRKSMIGNILNRKISDRLYGSLAAELIAFLKGANIIRTHNVSASYDILNTVSVLKKYDTN